MKQFALFILFSFLSINTYAQTYKVDLNFNVKKNYENWKKGSTIHITGVKHDSIPNPYSDGKSLMDAYLVLQNDNDAGTLVTKKMDDAITCDYKNIQDLWDAGIITSVFPALQKKGTQNALRNEMEEDVLEYISRIKNANLEFTDPYLENYIYSLIAKIAPENLIDGRPSNINLLIVKDPAMNVCMYPNGTLVINTGLLAVLHTEDELVAILSHSIAHFVLDHSVQNQNASIARKKRADFWAAVATNVTLTVASKSKYYVPGDAAVAVGELAKSIAIKVVERLGMKYNNEQEYEADQMAINALKLLGYNQNALSSALNRIKERMLEERSKAMFFDSFTHPALVSRINKAGKPESKVDPNFEKIISFAVLDAALMKYQDRRYRQVLPLVSENIANNVAVADDYILKANCLLALRNTNESNTEALNLIGKAKALEPSNINIYKSEIVAMLRLNRKAEAQAMLKEYSNNLNTMSNELKSIPSGPTWEGSYSFITTESKWVNNMIIKLKGM